MGDKYFFEDLGLRHAIVRYRQEDINRVMENLVFHHCRIAGYEVTVGQVDKREIDFVCDKEGERLYLQVAYTITEDNREREFGNLLAIPDNYRKIVVSLDPLIGGATHKGIEHLGLRKFLQEV